VHREVVLLAEVVAVEQDHEVGSVRGAAGLGNGIDREGIRAGVVRSPARPPSAPVARATDDGADRTGVGRRHRLGILASCQPRAGGAESHVVPAPASAAVRAPRQADRA
jgi:hypothetical protein